MVDKEEEEHEVDEEEQEEDHEQQIKSKWWTYWSVLAPAVCARRGKLIKLTSESIGVDLEQFE